MSRRRAQSLSSLLAVAILAALPVASAWAQQGPPQGKQGRGGSAQDRRDQDGRSLSDAVRRVERDTRGEVLSAERVQYDGRDMHRVKVVDDRGRVRVFMQDPERRGGRDADQASSSRGSDDRRGRDRRPPARGNDD